MYRLLIADDHPLFRDAVVSAMEQAFEGIVVLQSEDLDATLGQAKADDTLDLILLDLKMPGMDGLEGLTTLRREAPTIPVVIVSAETDRDIVLKAMALGAVGYISKASPRARLIEALRQVLDGHVYLPPDIIRQPSADSGAAQRPDPPPGVDPERLRTLTRRQWRVLQRMVEGESNRQIADRLNIAETTVKSHVSSILSKLGVRSRLQAILAAGDVDFTRRPEP